MPLLRALIVPLVLLAACGGGHLSGQQPGDAGQVTDGGQNAPTSFVAWPVANGTVTAYAVDATGARTTILGETTTDSSGGFLLQLSAPSTGPILVVVSSGTYTEPATGTTISVQGSELTALLPSEVHVVGDSLDGVLISPISFLTERLTAWNVSSAQLSVDAALAQSAALIESHFGGLAWRTFGVPPDLTAASSSGLVQLNDLAKGALILAGLSQEARDLAIAKSLSPGGPLNSLTLLAALGHDLSADGFFDGVGSSATALQVPAGANGYLLDGQTVRARLAQGITAFLANPLNMSKIATADAQTLVNEIGTDSNAKLFRASTGVVDLVPPTIQFVQPANNASVHGSVTIEAVATDNVAVASFVFTTPSALVGIQATTESNGTSMHLLATLDVSSLPDGALTITALATDTSSNSASQSLAVRVANHGPTINIMSPSDGSTVRGTVTISATATSQSGAAITDLEITGMLAGLGTDQLPAAEQLQVPWDTTKMLEGPAQITFHAEDATGAATDLTVSVTVDNIPFGIFDAYVSIGAPLANANIQVIAIDPSTGLIDTSSGVSGVLGSGGPTDKNGYYRLTLNTENYRGPVQVVASGANLTYVDPSDGTTVISVPNSASLTSFVADYTSGAEVALPVDLWTTLADTEAIAYTQGLNRSAPVAHDLSDALGFTDPLFQKHITSSTWSLRTTQPASLTTAQQTLADVVYAAVPDVALNSLARDLSKKGNLDPGGVSAFDLLALLEQDLVADGQFDGKGAGGAQLQTVGHPVQSLDANTLRVYLAFALDEFVQGGTNKTTLARPDFQNAGIYDTISNDTSALFGSESPIAFDDSPPSVSFSATFTPVASGSSPHSPVGSNNLVSGTLALSATATDPSGVATLSLLQNGVVVTPAAGSAPPNSILYSIDTTTLSDGPLTFTAVSSDTFANSGNTTFTVSVANAAPTITFAPIQNGQAGSFLASGYYANSVPVDSSANDAHGISTFTMTGLAGFNDLDGSVDRIAGNWSVPAAQPDGPISVSFSTCNIVYVCGSSSRSFNIDRTPPALHLTSSVGPYTANFALTLNVTAADLGSGVATASAQVGNGAIVAGTLQPDGSFSIPVVLQSGSNSIAMWAVDRAGNSGEGMATPQQLSVNVIYDAIGPTINSPDVTVSKYRDETGLQLQTSSPGVPVMPPQYTYLGGVVSAPSGTINKVSTRLGWAQQGLPQPTPGELVGTNPNNYPFYYFTIGALSGVVSTSYTVTVTQTSATSSGSLWPVDATHYILPLTADTVPGLLSLPASTTPYTLEISVAATSGSGVTPAPSNFTQSFSVLGPPLTWIEDTAIKSASFDSSSTYRHALADGSYGSMFSSGTPVKLIRYLIKNPSSVPVGFMVSGAGSWDANETWATSVGALPAYLGGQYTAPDGSVLTNPVREDDGAGYCGYEPGCSNGAFAIHTASSDLLNEFDCDFPPVPTAQLFAAENDATANTALSVFGNPQPNGGETAPPSSTTDGYYVVPGASAGQPGELVVYVTRPGSVTRQTNLDYQDLDSQSGTSPRFEVWLADYWPTKTGVGVCGVDDRGDTFTYSTYSGNREIEYLSAAVDVLNGLFGFSTTGLNASASASIGHTTTIVRAQSFSRNISH